MALSLRRRPAGQVSSPVRVARDANKMSSLTASGERIRKATAESVSRLSQPWQARSFAYYDALGEIKYAAQFYSRGLSSLQLVAAERNDEGDFVPTENQQAIEALDRIQDPGGGRSGLLGAYGRLMFLVGEALLFVSQDEDTGLEQWEMLSAAELRIQGRTYFRYRAPEIAPEEYREPQNDDWRPVEDQNAVAYRLWRRHPLYSSRADATMQAVLDLCEELVLLTQAVRARARSRLAGAGILFLDDSVTTPVAPEPGTDEDPEADPFLRDLTEAMTVSIVDEGAASAVVPLVVRLNVGDGDINKLIKHLQLVDPTQLYPETGLRYEVIKRIAFGLDMPPEILLGLGDSNHWSAWQIDEQTWKGHLQPVAQQLVDDLTASYFRPSLRAAGVSDWDRYAIIYDAAEIVQHPDRGKDAKDVHDRGALSNEALRESTGFDENDAPSPQEHQEWLGIKLRDSQLAVTGEPRAPSPGPGQGQEPGAGDDATPDGPPVGTAPEVTPGPPPEPDAGARNGRPAEASVRVAEMTARVIGAADLTMLRAREAAGNRLRSLVKRDDALVAELEGVPTRQVAAVLGRDRVRPFAAVSDLVEPTRGLILDALRVWEIPEPVAVLVADRVVQHAGRTLFDEKPRPLPPTFQSYVASVLASPEPELEPLPA